MFQFYISIDSLLMNCKTLQSKSMAFQMEYRVPVTVTTWAVATQRKNRSVDEWPAETVALQMEIEKNGTSVNGRYRGKQKESFPLRWNTLRKSSLVEDCRTC